MRKIKDFLGRGLSLARAKGNKSDDMAGIVSSDHAASSFLGLLRVKTLRARDIMIPRADIASVHKNIDPRDLLKLISDRPFSYYPVYDENPDDIVGVLHIKKVTRALTHVDQFKVMDNLSDVLFVSPSMKVLELYVEMQSHGTTMALVVDEFGGIDGLVTTTDILDAIMGEIQDLNDAETKPTLFERSDGSVLVSGRLSIEEFEDKFGAHFSPYLKDEDIETIGGLVFFLIGRVPNRGEVISYKNGIEFDIIEADARRIMYVVIRNIPHVPSHDSSVAQPKT